MKTPINVVPYVKLFCANVLFSQGKAEEAIKEIDSGLEHTCTAIDLYIYRCKYLLSIGKVHDALKAAKEYKLSNSADRSASNLYIKLLQMYGLPKRAEVEGTLFAGFEQNRNLLFDTQFNTFYIHQGYIYLRLGDDEKAKSLYEGVLKHYDDYKVSQYTYIGWAAKKPRALIELNEFLERIETDRQFYLAARWAIRLALKQNKEKEYLDRALQCIKSKDPETLSLCIFIFAKNNLILPAVKCWRLIKDTEYRFLAIDMMRKLMKEQMSDIVRSVAEEFFEDINSEPQTFDEIICSAEGKMLYGDIESSKTLFKKAFDLSNIPFKKVLRAHTIIKSFGKEELSKELLELIVKKYPNYELLPVDENEVNEHKEKRAKEKKEIIKQRKEKRDKLNSENPINE